ncbi:MAG: amidophosphoribosyltransferase [Victivallales bacterium]|nr:amidophosphoribosyltransferase [Victivallales bacterium]
MGGFFGCVSKTECLADIFYGTDYHSHLGNMRGGIMVLGENGFQKVIHDIRNAQFRSKFERDLDSMHGLCGIGCISDTDSQPLTVFSSSGTFGITMVGVINNLEDLQAEFLQNRHTHFTESWGNGVSPTEVAASLIASASSLAEGLRTLQDKIDGSCSVLLLTEQGVYASRDKVGRTPIVIGRKEDGSLAASFESCALHNLGYKVVRWMGPGEAVLLNRETFEIDPVLPARKIMKMCAFMWIYYGFPAASYEGINVEQVRYRCGENLAKQDNGLEVDAVAGVPDSGTAHALGYAGYKHLPYRRSFVKYTPTWPRSFISDSQTTRRHVAKMKLIPIQEFIHDQKLLFCEDSIVRGTQLKDTFARLPEWGAKEIHVRAACPPILFGCKFLNFSPSRSPLELIARRAVHAMENGQEDEGHLEKYTDATTPEYQEMVRRIRKEMGFTTLKYQTLEDTIKAIGFPAEKLCTYCWTGKD